MRIESFHIEIQNGKVMFKSDHHKHLFERFVAQFPDGKYRLEITSKKEKRSAEQNRYYHFYLGLIARETGHTSEELHEWAKGKFLSTGISEIFGEKVRKKKSTTELSKGEFCDYLANIMVETGVELPDTTEFYGYSYHR
jgi:hypothetical protein